MNTHKLSIFLLLSLLLMSCVTINVYFPAAAAEEAAKEIVNEVLKEDTSHEPPPQSNYQLDSILYVNVQKQFISRNLTDNILDLLISPAQAQVNISINTPKIRSIRNKLKSQLNQMRSAFNNGHVGYTDQGLVKIRNMNALNIKQKSTLKKQLSHFNSLLKQLYIEIADANGHPEWHSDIQKTFARTWITEMSSGWKYYKNGQWLSK